MAKENLRQQLINDILIKNDDEDNEGERSFLEQLSLPELQALAGASLEDEELPDES